MTISLCMFGNVRQRHNLCACPYVIHYSPAFLRVISIMKALMRRA